MFGALKRGFRSTASLSILYSKQRYGHRSTSLTPITSAMLCYVMLYL